MTKPPSDAHGGVGAFGYHLPMAFSHDLWKAKVRTIIGPEADAAAIFHSLRHSIFSGNGWARWRMNLPGGVRQVWAFEIAGTRYFAAVVVKPERARIFPVTLLEATGKIRRASGKLTTLAGRSGHARHDRKSCKSHTPDPARLSPTALRKLADEG